MERNGSKPSIALIGMMGAGKSRVGKALARGLGWPFVDLDQWIEDQHGRSVVEIFELFGEAAFRRMEQEAVLYWSEQEGVVLATGGGTILNDDNRMTLCKRYSIIYLRATLDTLWRRVRRSCHRPLLRVAKPKARLHDILVHREQRYEACADIVVDTDPLSIEAVVEAILTELNVEVIHAHGECESREE